MGRGRFNICWVPLLFFIYIMMGSCINDLPNCLTSCQPRMYTDDTHITYADVDVNSIQLKRGGLVYREGAYLREGVIIRSHRA